MVSSLLKGGKQPRNEVCGQDQGHAALAPLEDTALNTLPPPPLPKPLPPCGHHLGHSSRASIARRPTPTWPRRVKNLYTTEGFPWMESPTLSPSDIL